jgi:SAM-dependent methyltransferase
MSGRGEAAAGMQRIIDDARLGRISPAVACMQLLMETRDLATARAILQDAYRQARDPRLTALLAFIDDHPAGSALVARMLAAGVDHGDTLPTPEAGVAFSQRLFDWAVQQSEEASVALYSFGSPELLGEATAEIVAYLDARGLLGPDRRVLDIGCGIARLAVALADQVGTILGLDVSPGMVAVARRRCQQLRNVEIRLSSGLGLPDCADEDFDLIAAVDSFPYIVQSGLPLAERFLVDIRRTLRPGGWCAIMNFSYRDDPELDKRDVARVAATVGLDVVDHGLLPFRLWDGMVFLLRRSR